MRTISIENIFAGKKQDIVDKRDKQYESSYKKALIADEVLVKYIGFVNDTQTDTSHHGGVDKAVCVYTKKNYDFFKRKYDLDLPLCAFGENITLLDIDDSEVCLGDQYRCGTVVFEVSQPREPCWKISSILGIKNMTSLVVKEFKTGFYLRVLQEGSLDKNSHFELISRVHPELSIEFINKVYYKSNVEEIQQVLKCKELGPAYKLSLEKRLKSKLKRQHEWQDDDYIITIGNQTKNK
ncbi:MAG: MOSC domain-containing protein [Campylobacteraceae bacterium]|nr:MOSC domain-containing protein [Campylobacteraceae bacterium]